MVVEFCQKLGFQRVILEGSDEMLIKTLADENWERNGRVRKEIKQFLKQATDWNITFTYRSRRNKLVANKLAKMAIRAEGSRLQEYYIEDGPDDIISLILADKVM